MTRPGIHDEAVSWHVLIASAGTPGSVIRRYIKSEQEKWASLVRKLGLEGSQ